MSAEVFDYAIVGGGCAGLSLAVGLSERLPDARLVLIEPRTEYRRDRTWCYWRVGSHRFESAVSHAWHRWKVRRNGQEIIQECSRYPYQHISADAFYRTALRALTAAPNVTLRLGVKAQVISAANTQVTIETEQGRIHAGCAFDSRPPAPRDGLLQHFAGWRLQTAAPVFSPATVTLMDFDVPQSDGIHFFYVLPYSPCEALVEATFITRGLLPAAHYQAAIRRYLTQRYRIREYTVLDQEQGVIPMSAVAPRLHPAPRMYRIGTAGGLVKASSGYGFLPIQRWTARWVERLAGDPLPEPPLPRPRAARWLDRVFLSYLGRFPERAPAVFQRLFERVEAESLARFLSDAGTPRDYAAVIGAMPALPFARETLRWRRRWELS
jgi:lycopene beta-cyclase